MKKNANSWSFKRYFLIFLGIVIVNFFFDLYNKSSETIEIIGGADGPTAIFVAERTGPSRVGFFGLLFLIVLVIYLPIKKLLKNK